MVSCGSTFLRFPWRDEASISVKLVLISFFFVDLLLLLSVTVLIIETFGLEAELILGSLIISFVVSSLPGNLPSLADLSSHKDFSTKIFTLTLAIPTSLNPNNSADFSDKSIILPC